MPLVAADAYSYKSSGKQEQESENPGAPITPSNLKSKRLHDRDETSLNNILKEKALCYRLVPVTNSAHRHDRNNCTHTNTDIADASSFSTAISAKKRRRFGNPSCNSYPRTIAATAETEHTTCRMLAQSQCNTEDRSSKRVHFSTPLVSSTRTTPYLHPDDVSVFFYSTCDEARFRREYAYSNDDSSLEATEDEDLYSLEDVPLETSTSDEASLPSGDKQDDCFLHYDQELPELDNCSSSECTSVSLDTLNGPTCANVEDDNSSALDFSDLESLNYYTTSPLLSENEILMYPQLYSVDI